MATTNATVAILVPEYQQLFVGGLRSVLAKVTLTADYEGTGGSDASNTVQPNLLGLAEVHFVAVEQPAGYVVSYDHTENCFVVYWTGAGTSAVLAEVTDGTDLHTVSFRAWFFGV